MAPENLKDYFKNMTDEEKSIGKELWVIGYALTYKSWILREANKLNIKGALSKYLQGLPQEIMVVNKFYNQTMFGIGFEDQFYRETIGYKFAIEHMTKDRLLIEPYIRTELIGFPEFFHKRSNTWYQRLSDSVSSLTSTDPFINYSYSSSILFEGDYITAFGLISYNIDSDTFTMTKPLAIVKGGIEALKNYFSMKFNEKAGIIYALTIVSTLLTVGTFACYKVGKHYYKKMQERNELAAEKVIEIDSLKCMACGNKKRDVIFEPCLHILYWQDCCTKEDSQLDKRKLQKCEKCGKKIDKWNKIFIP